MKSLLASVVLALALLPAGAATKKKPAPPPAPPVEGKVTQIVDGATFVLQPAAGGAPLTVRLKDTVPPESCQPWADEARAALKEFTDGQVVTVKQEGKDKQGRTIGAVTVEDQDLSRRMVEEGHLFAGYTKFDRGPYVKHERVAHSLRRGMYASGIKVMRPDEFLRDRGQPCPAQPK